MVSCLCRYKVDVDADLGLGVRLPTRDTDTDGMDDGGVMPAMPGTIIRKRAANLMCVLHHGLAPSHPVWVLMLFCFVLSRWEWTRGWGPSG
jgi:hypothetical protein